MADKWKAALQYKIDVDTTGVRERLRAFLDEIQAAVDDVRDDDHDPCPTCGHPRTEP